MLLGSSHEQAEHPGGQGFVTHFPSCVFKETYPLTQLGSRYPSGLLVSTSHYEQKLSDEHSLQPSTYIIFVYF